MFGLVLLRHHSPQTPAGLVTAHWAASVSGVPDMGEHLDVLVSHGGTSLWSRSSRSRGFTGR